MLLKCWLIIVERKDEWNRMQQLNPKYAEPNCSALGFKCPLLFCLGQRRGKDLDEHHYAVEKDLQPSVHVPAYRGESFWLGTVSISHSHCAALTLFSISGIFCWTFGLSKWHHQRVSYLNIVFYCCLDSFLLINMLTNIWNMKYT